jgi:hypothetical protein
MQALKQDILDYPDAYQYERAERLGVSQMGICHALRRIGHELRSLPQKRRELR